MLIYLIIFYIILESENNKIDINVNEKSDNEKSNKNEKKKELKKKTKLYSDLIFDENTMITATKNVIKDIYREDNMIIYQK